MNIRLHRPHCTCLVVQNYDYDQAAEKLGCLPRFLQDNISRFTHQRIGQSRVFCECELRLIQSQLTIFPVTAPAEAAKEDDKSAVRTLRDIKPAGARTSRAS